MARWKKVAIVEGKTSIEGILERLTAYVTRNDAKWMICSDVYHNAFVGLKAEPLGPLEDFQGDGIIYASIGRLDSETRVLAKIDRLPVPVVYSAPCSHEYRLPCVLSDNRAIGRLMAEHLLETGLREFAFLGFKEDVLFLHDRELGFREGLAEKGLSCAIHRDSEISFSLAAGNPSIRRLSRWLKGLPRPVGIGACYDGYGLIVCRLCERLGIHLPQETAVIGAGNDRALCDSTCPPLSSVAQDAQQQGWRVATLLDELMAGGRPPDTPILISPQGVVRRGSSDILRIDDPLVVRCLQHIQERIDEGISVDMLLEEVRVSQRTLERRFKKALGYTPAVAIRRTQVDRAKELLAETDLSMTKIAYACNFSSQAYFNQVFRRFTKQTPTAYRKQMRDG